MSTNRIAVPVAEAARMLGVSRSTMYVWIDEGRVRAFEYPGVRGRRIRVAELEAVVEAAAAAESNDRARRHHIARIVGGRRG